MFDMNNVYLSQIKQQEMLKEAAHQRLIRQGRIGQPSRMAQLRYRLGAMMSNLGQRLHNEAAMPGAERLQNNA